MTDTCPSTVSRGEAHSTSLHTHGRPPCVHPLCQGVRLIPPVSIPTADRLVSIHCAKGWGSFHQSPYPRQTALCPSTVPRGEAHSTSLHTHGRPPCVHPLCQGVRLIPPVSIPTADRLVSIHCAKGWGSFHQSPYPRQTALCPSTVPRGEAHSTSLHTQGRPPCVHPLCQGVRLIPPVSIPTADRLVSIHCAKGWGSFHQSPSPRQTALCPSTVPRGEAHSTSLHPHGRPPCVHPLCQGVRLIPLVSIPTADRLVSIHCAKGWGSFH